MHDAPKLAVIISCYNYETFVNRAIRSVVSQGRNDCELVVIDDGSTDNSWDVIARSGVTAFKISNEGQRTACLFGLDQTTAPFVLFLDADDELKPGALGAIIDRLDAKVAKLQFPLTRIDANGDVISQASPSLTAFRDSVELARQVLQTGVYKTPPTSGNVFRRDVCQFLREAKYDRAVDGVILFAAPFMGDVVSVSEELGCYRIHGRNDSGVGGAPDAHSLERDINRFVARMDHLRDIIRRCNHNLELVPSHEAFYFQERSFCLAVAAGKRPSVTFLPHLLYKLADAPYLAKTKIAMALFFILALLLPIDRAKALLAYRFRVGHRSTLGFIKEIIACR